MSLERDDPALGELLDRLGICLTDYLTRAADLARVLHAEALYPEHLLLACVEGGDSAARAVIEGAFADPDTLADEIRAISPGLSVVGGWGSVPFSPGALRAMRTAFAALPDTAEPQDQTKGPPLEALPLAQAARGELPPEVLVTLEGQRDAPPGGGPSPSGHPDKRGAEVDDGRMFRSLAGDTRRLLAAAGRMAWTMGDGALGPAHLYIAHLDADKAWSREEGITATGARSLLDGCTRDPQSPEPRDLPLTEELVSFLKLLPAGADSLSVLINCHAVEGGELGQLLTRHRLSTTLLEAARSRHRDPEPVRPPENPQ